MRPNLSLTIVIAYLLIILITLSIFGYNLFISTNGKFSEFNLLILCILVGGFGGTLYCLRGVYLNYSVLNRWSNQWVLWFYCS